MTSLREHHASPSSNWALAKPMRGFWYAMGGAQQGPPGSQAESCELALALADLCRPAPASWLKVFHCLSVTLDKSSQPLGLQWRNFMAYHIIINPKPLMFIVASCYRRKPHLFTCTPPRAGTEKQKSKVPGLRSHGGVQFLGMLTLAKLLERWPGNRSAESPLHISAATCSASLR